MPQWTFLTNHALVLSSLALRSAITAIEISSEIGITERAVRRIIADLDKEGYIVKEKEGRRVRYQVTPHMPLRHKTQRDKDVGDLLQVFGWKLDGANSDRRGPPENRILTEISINEPG
jgi:predicted ArsR family transcriptional regulator